MDDEEYDEEEEDDDYESQEDDEFDEDDDVSAHLKSGQDLTHKYLLGDLMRTHRIP